MSTVGRPRRHLNGKRLTRIGLRRQEQQSRNRITNFQGVACLRTNLPRRLGLGYTRHILQLIPQRIVLPDSKLNKLRKTDILVTRQTVHPMLNSVAGRGLHSTELHVHHLSLWEQSMASERWSLWALPLNLYEFKRSSSARFDLMSLRH